MPAYEYKCEGCGHEFEMNHPMNENPVIFCPECKGRSKKIITGGAGFIMKGSHQKDTGIQCGREQTCCGRSTPCDTRPCHK
jgi:putative FmdB family regulatory protein